MAFKKPYQIVFSDLYGTLVSTLSGAPTPKGIWDLKFNFDVLDALEELGPKYLCIVFNQDGLDTGLIDKRNFDYKMEYIIRSIAEYTGIPTVKYDYCAFEDPDNVFRKPNTMMLFSRHKHKINSVNPIPVSDILMIGNDAFSPDHNEECAKNYGIDYLDVNDFIDYVNVNEFVSLVDE